jgi:PAS domain S-box-containing protein
MDLTPTSNIDLYFEPSPSTKGKYLVFDTETSGLLPRNPGDDPDPDTFPVVIQVAWLLFDEDGKRIDAQNRYILQNKPIPPDSTLIHGIDDAMVVQKGEKPSVVWNDFLSAVANCEYLIAHNIDFDIPVIRAELSRLHIHNPFAGKYKLCTMKLGKDLCKIPSGDGNGYKYPTLDELYKICVLGEHSEIQISGMHDAYIDAAVTAKVFFNLLNSTRIRLEDAEEEHFRLPEIQADAKPVKGKFFVQIILPTTLTILLFFLTIFFIIIPRFKETIMIGKRQTIEELTRSASSILEKYHNDERAGIMTREVAQQTAISRIRYLHYGAENKDYFWITDMEPNMVMHPYRGDLDGKSLKEFKDPHGKKLFVEMVEVCRKNGQGYVEYMWQWKDDSLHIVPKLSYVQEFKPWGWIIGTGIYIEDVQKEIRSLTRRLLIISFGISMVIAMLLTYITLQSMRIERKRVNAEGQLRISREKYKTLVDATTEGLIMMLDHKMIFSNNKIHDLTGFTEQEIASRPLSRLISEKNPPETIRIFENRNLPDGRYEVTLKMKSGGQFDSLVTISSIFFAEKSGKLITVKDASINKAHDGKADDLLEILEFAGIGFIRILLDSRGKILFSNRAMCRILGFSDAKELSHFSILDFFADSADRKKYLPLLMTEGSVKKASIRLKRKDGRLCTVSASLSVLKDEAQQLMCDGIIEDITDNLTALTDKDHFISGLLAHSLLIHNSVAPCMVPVPEVQLYTPVIRVIDLMKKGPAGTVLVTNENGTKLGIVTAGDITRRVLLTGMSLQQPVYEIMSAPLIMVNQGDTLKKAVNQMDNAGISRLVVNSPAGSMPAIVPAGEISRLFHHSFSFIESEIETAGSVEELAKLYRRFQSYLSIMVRQNVNPVPIGKSIASVSDTITARLIRLAIEEIGEPPAEFAFVVLGSEGRLEQTLATDQDNAIIYSDVHSGDHEMIQAWFNNLGEMVCDNLNAIGFRYCKGRVMAKNPLWCKPLTVWKNYFSNWISTPEPKSLLDISIFFDLRAIFGYTPLVDDLRQHIDRVSDGNASFFYNLADNILSMKPSIGMTGAIHVEKKESRELFDLKSGVTPYIAFARIYSLFHKIPATNTSARIHALYELKAIPLTTMKEVLFGYEFLMMLRYRQQVATMEKSHEINNMIDLRELLDVEELILKKSLSHISDFQNRLNIDFKKTIL